MALLKLTKLWTRQFWANTLEAALLAGISAALAVVLHTGTAHIDLGEVEQAGTAALAGAGYSLLKSFHVGQTTAAIERGETIE